MTDPSDARARIKAIQLCRRRSDADIDFLLCHIAGLEGEATIKDAYAYELAKERDALDTQLGDALERLALLEKADT